MRGSPHGESEPSVPIPVCRIDTDRRKCQHAIKQTQKSLGLRQVGLQLCPLVTGARFWFGGCPRFVQVLGQRLTAGQGCRVLYGLGRKIYWRMIEPTAANTLSCMWRNGWNLKSLGDQCVCGQTGQTDARRLACTEKCALCSRHNCVCSILGTCHAPESGH